MVTGKSMKIGTPPIEEKRVNLDMEKEEDEGIALGLEIRIGAGLMNKLLGTALVNHALITMKETTLTDRHGSLAVPNWILLPSH